MPLLFIKNDSAELFILLTSVLTEAWFLLKSRMLSAVAWNLGCVATLVLGPIYTSTSVLSLLIPWLIPSYGPKATIQLVTWSTRHTVTNTTVDYKNEFL